MTILMLTPSPNIRGPIMKHTPILVEELRTLGCAIDTLPWGANENDEKLSRKISGRILSIVQVHELLKKNIYDLLIIKTAHDWAAVIRDLTLLWTTRHLRPLTILQIHGSQSHRLAEGKPKLFKKATKVVLDLCDGVMLLSTEEQNDFMRFYASKKFWTVENPVVLNSPEKVVHNQWSLPNSKSKLLFVGRLVKEKGIFELLHAVATLTQKHDIHLLILGVGPEENAVKKLIDKLGISKTVTLGGYTEGQKLIAAYKEADILILPSWIEGFPTVVTEAMQHGTAIVTTKIRGVADHLIENENAIYTPVNDANALASNIEKLVNNPQLRDKIVQTNKVKVQDFLPKPVALRYLETIYKIINQKTIPDQVANP